MLEKPAELLERLEQSGLLSPSIIEHRDKLLGTENAEKAADELVRLNLLTEYQARVAVKDDAVPLSIGDYIVEDMIGRGGMGFVLKARHRRMKRQVAIKFLHKSMTESPDLVARFEREVEAAAQLHHQNIVTAYDAGEHDGSHYLVMQFVDGQDLSHRVKRDGPLRVCEAIDVIRQAAEGLGYAHEKGIVHRDIKPGNLLLDREGVVRILDMGLARMRPSPGDALDGGAHADLTNTGSVMGTVDYMAPEQALDAKTVDFSADIYSLGCTLYFLLTSNPPFRGDTIMRRLLAHREQDVPLISHVRPEAPRELDQVFATMMAKKKEDRYPSMRHLIVALNSIELEDSEAEQKATIDAPDDGTGGFIKLPEADDLDDLADFVDTSSFTGPSATTPTGSAVVEPASFATDATLIESDSRLSQTVVVNDASSLAQDESFSDAPSDATLPATESTAPSTGRSASGPPWKVITPVAAIILAVAGFFSFRGDSDSDQLANLESPTNATSEVAESAPLQGAAERSADAEVPPPSSPSDTVTSHTEREITEWLIGLGATVTIYDGERALAVTEISSLPDDDEWIVRNISLDTLPEDESLARLSQLKKLQVLQVTGPSFGDRIAADVGNCQQLLRLWLAGTTMTDVGFAAAIRSPLLIELSLAGNESVTENTLNSVGKVSSLTDLVLNTTPIEDDWLKRLQNLDHLTSLDLAHTPVTSVGLRHLAPVPLETIMLHGTSLHGDEWAALQELKSLRYVQLGGSQERAHLDPESVTALAGCPNLTGLHVTFTGLSPEILTPLTQLQRLELTGVAFESSELSSLASLGNLQELRFAICDLTDDDLQPLRGLPKLRELILDEEGVTEDAIQELHKALPGCRIRSKHGTIEADPVFMSPDRRAAE